MTDPLKMSKYEMKDEDALSLAKVDLGFSTDRALRQMAGELSEKKKEFWNSEAMKCFLQLLKRVLDKTPIRSSFVRQTTCLNPKAMAHDLIDVNEGSKGF